MATSIYYDFETSDTNSIGQILNFSFSLVDSEFRTLRNLSGNIRLSRLQLPRAGAILANRIDVERHQKVAEFSEKQAAAEIFSFINTAIEDDQASNLIGFNSSKFDLLHLRTLLIRNGINPYFKGKIQSRDVFLLARKLYCTESKFPELAIKKQGDDGKERYSLSLESLAKTFGLLKSSERQSHESKEDVNLTIELAAKFKQLFKADIAKFEAYEAVNLHRSKRGSVFETYEPKLDIEQSSKRQIIPMVLLDADHKSALWIDLHRFKEKADRSAIKWISIKTGSLFTDGKLVSQNTEKEHAERALKELHGINLKNFFTRSVCDIEQDIYRLDMAEIDKLHAIMWDGKDLKLENKDTRTVLTRHKLVEYVWGSGDDARVEKLLREYSLYRYGGKAVMYKNGPSADNPKAGYHPSFKELLGEVEELEKGAAGDSKQLLLALKRYYLDSDIYRVAGDELS